MFSYKYDIPLNEPSSQMDLRLYCCGTEECLKSNTWGPAIKDHYIIHYIKSGSGILIVDGRTYNFTKGQCFLISPNIITYYKANDNEPWFYYWVAFSGLNAQSYLRRTDLSPNHPIITCKNHERVANCFEQMFTGSSVKPSGDLSMLSSLYLLISLMIDNVEDNRLSGKLKGKDNSYVAKAIEWFEINYSRSISISEISDLIGLSHKYFSKVFKEETSMSPQNFLINMRLNKACELMKNSDLSIGEISRSVSYNDQLQFSRIFKKLKGISPRAYRSQTIPN